MVAFDRLMNFSVRKIPDSTRFGACFFRMEIKCVDGAIDLTSDTMDDQLPYSSLEKCKANKIGLVLFRTVGRYRATEIQFPDTLQQF